MMKLIRRLANRQHSTASISVTLWSKADCCLCDRALAILERLAREYPLQIDKRDITTDPTTYERFRFVIPVVEIEHGPRLEGKITEYWLRQALDRRSG